MHYFQIFLTVCIIDTSQLMLCPDFVFLFSGDSFERARRLQEKMRTNLVMAKDRLDVLGMYLELGRYNDVKEAWLSVLYKYAQLSVSCFCMCISYSFREHPKFLMNSKVFSESIIYSGQCGQVVICFIHTVENKSILWLNFPQAFSLI